ncbi:tol-pal system protein YbgF [Massilia sp. TS11]|uniref:tol-pal system protein YbgF n=1 Tax=Massilia sp. TS11 TaxID=2908003 RepID=UPI001EDBD42E|nr:tol-pal system protein YbgF [Massilia sp. TS11]MCG2586153.1 tol-pal system protein YbgF [Massilia sp. TS11]
MNTSRIRALLLALVCSAPLVAHAGLLDDDEARKAILDLRAKVDRLVGELNARIDTKVEKSALTDIVNDRERVMEQIAQLRGQIEVLANEIAKAQKAQKDLYVDLDNRLKKLEPRKTTIDGKEVTIAPDEQKSYDAAMLLFKAGDYKAAAQSLGEFVRRYPESAFAPNAQYWLGNSYFAQRDCTNAIAAQQVVLSAYADSPKAPDAMLNIASCYVELKDKKNAKKTYQDLIAKFPGTPAAATAKDRLATIK